MPRTKLDKYKNGPRDRLREALIGRLETCGRTREDLCKSVGCSRPTLNARLATPIKDWRYGEVLRLARELGIPIEELRSLVSY